MTVIRGAFGAVDELGAAYRNDVEDVRAMVYHALGGTQGILDGFVMSTVAAAMEVDFTAGQALIEERGVDINGDDRGYFVFATTTTTVTFDAASVADRNDAVVFAWPDPQYGTIGAGVSVAGPQIVVVKGVSGSTTPRTDSEINTAIGVGGWFRYADVIIDSTDTEINPANITLTYPNANDRVGYVQAKWKTADQSVTSTSAVDDTHLNDFSVVAGATYLVAPKFAVTNPGGSSQIFSHLLEGPSGDWTSVQQEASFRDNVTTSQTVSDQVGAGGTIGAFSAHLYQPASSGLLKARVFVDGGTINVRQGSYLRVERVG